MSGELCDCETFAVGRCSECRTWVCGDHSQLVEGRRLCDTHVAARVRADQAVRDNTERGKRAGRAAMLKQLATIADPIQRLLTGLRLGADETELAQLCPGMVPWGGHGQPIAQWFAAQAGPHVPCDITLAIREERVGAISGRPRLVDRGTQAAWTFPAGSSHGEDAFVLADGRAVVQSTSPGAATITRTSGLGRVALMQMAKLLDLRLPEPIVD